ncbi:MAG: class I SAM-dependent RNA methyltransferase [Spirochaetaceae bacterium]|jgi:putative N6-adenine-specific DNA methylase|nr:class I SAM-dependent RNA methyltransferase [Spirochaetaceae bacterium]
MHREFIALCAPGAEKTLCNELRKLSESSGAEFSIRETRAGRVSFFTEPENIYLALMGLRCADRVLAVPARFSAGDFDELFEGVRAAPLEEYVPRDMPLVIEKVKSFHSKLAAQTSIQSVTHKAAAEKLCAAHGIRRLNEGPDGAALRIYLENDEALLLLDLCGEPLFKRGYRTETGVAPLRETIAAFVVLSSLWKRKHPLFDPFCGSGTIAIEAALYAWDIAPGLNRRFALQKLLCASQKAEDAARDFFNQRIDTERPARIFGSDSDGALVETARRNAERALGKAAAQLHFAKQNAADAQSFAQNGYIITNPPYGLRIGDKEDAERCAAELSQLWRRFAGWKLVAVSCHEGFESFFGKKAERCRELRCGAITRYAFEFEQQTSRIEDTKSFNPPKEKAPQRPPQKTNWTW